MNNKEYKYITGHGIGFGCWPQDAKLLNHEDLSNFKTIIYLNRLLTDDELDKYEIKPVFENIENIDSSNIELLWEAVCNNDINFVKNWYNKGLPKNIRYIAFGSKHSMIMGALRNKNMKIVNLLKLNGETILKSELDEYKRTIAIINYEDIITKNAQDI